MDSIDSPVTRVSQCVVMLNYEELQILELMKNTSQLIVSNSLPHKQPKGCSKGFLYKQNKFFSRETSFHSLL